MKRVNKIAQELKPNSLYNNLDIKTDMKLGPKFKDSFNQDLTVPCMPNNLVGEQLNKCNKKSSVYRDIMKDNYELDGKKSQAPMFSDGEVNSKDDINLNSNSK